MRGKETAGGIVTKFCTSVDIRDIIMYATFCADRLRGLGVARSRISRFPIDLRRRPYNTLALPCECVMIMWCFSQMIYSDWISGVLLIMLYDYRIDMSYHTPYDCDVDNCTVKCDFVLLYNILLSYKEGGM